MEILPSETSAGFIIIDKIAKEVLLVEGRKRHWGFPKGHQEKGETVEIAAQREVKEETNVSIENTTVHNEFHFSYTREKVKENGRRVNKTVHLFLCTTQKEKHDVKAQEGEILSAKFFPINEAHSKIEEKNLRKALKRAAKLVFPELKL